MKEWDDIPYYPISRFYRQNFGSKVYKISVSTAETCPNREGIRGMKTCNFCDVWGSAAYPEIREKPLREQIIETRERMHNMYKANSFLVYFQAYTNTFSKVTKLRENFETAFSFDDIVGVVVGTRPDCLSEAVYELWDEYSQDKFVAVEMGVQSFNEQQLIWMRRGHTAKKSIEAILKIKKRVPRVNIGIHLMFGLPGETDTDILQAASTCNELPIDNVKLHNLHVLKNTALEEDFLKGDFKPVEKDVYFQRCGLFLQKLNPNIAVHRLSALAPRHEELVAPIWTTEKMKTYQDMLDYMRTNNIYQGQHFQIKGHNLNSSYALMD